MSVSLSERRDPLTPLTKHERVMIRRLEKRGRDELLEELKDNLQTAVWIELATIPIYLFSYYSVQRAEKSGRQIRPADLYANKAGGVIMSVAVEEMLHMSLSSNILYSLGVEPQLYRKSPASYPTPLPYHDPVGPPGPKGKKDAKVLIPLSKLTYEQLWHFLQIEYPEPAGAWPKDRNWKTIGQFYSYIRCLILTRKIHHEDFQAGPRASQIQHYNYSPNNVDTVYPRGKFDNWGMPPKHPPRPPKLPERPQGPRMRNYKSASGAAAYPNEPDSHALRTIGSKRDALEAIETICEQGEGYAHGATDDSSKTEESHFYKFLELQAQMEPYKHHVEKLPKEPEPPPPIRPTVTEAELAEVIVNFPDNPITRPVGRIANRYVYPQNVRALSDLCNGVYQYMLIMTETIFRVPPEEQKLFFNIGMHRSMIWILDKLIQAMRKIDLGDGHQLAPTFENIDLGERKVAYRNLIKLTEAVTDPEQLSAVGYLIDTIWTLPDVSEYWKD